MRLNNSTLNGAGKVLRWIGVAFGQVIAHGGSGIRLKRQAVALALLPGIVIACFSVADAQAHKPTQQDMSNLSLEDLMKVEIYTASKHWQKLAEAPSSISIVTADEIQKYGYRTLADILQSVRGIYISYDRNYSYVGVRGLSRPGDYNSRMLLLVNGHRMNDNVYNQASIGTDFPIDVDLIERVEVVRGPSSSLYGASAFFGVINVVTKQGRDLKGPVVSFAAGSFGTYKGRLSFGERFRNGLDMALSGSFYDSAGSHRLFFREFADPATNNGVAVDADYDKAQSLLGSLSFGDFGVQAVYGSREKGIPTGSYGTVFNDPRTRTIDAQGYVDLQYQHCFSDGFDLSARVSYDRYSYDGTYIYDYDGNGKPPFVENVDRTRGAWWSTELNASKTLMEKHSVKAGIEYHDNLRQDQSNYDIDPFLMHLDDKRTSKVWALFAQDEFRPRKDLIISAGLRYDHYYSFGGTTNPRVAVIYSPWDRTTVKLLYGQAFRSPNSFELYYGEGGTNEANPRLMPETIKTSEIVVEQYLGKHVRFTASGFSNRIHGLITQRLDPTNGLIQFSNLQDVRGNGLESEIEGKWSGGLEARVSYALQSSQNAETGNVLSNSPKTLAKINLIAPLVGRGLSAGFEGLYSGARRTLGPTDLRPYFVSNLTLLSQKLWKGLDVSIGAYNLLNTRYADPGAEEHRQKAIEQDGRSFRLKLTYRFDWKN